jgi:uncharacterized protein YkwD
VDAVRRLVAVLSIVIVGVALVPATASAARGLTRTERQTIALVNEARAAEGLRPLRHDGRLRRAAVAHTRDMLRRGYFAHGETVERLSRYVSEGVIGESLAWGSGTLASPEETVRRWLESPPHRAILLDPEFRLIGIGSRGGPFKGEPWARVYTANLLG